MVMPEGHTEGQNVVSGQQCEKQRRGQGTFWPSLSQKLQGPKVQGKIKYDRLICA